MTHFHFQEQLKRLVLAFGEKATNEEKARLLWVKFKHIDDQLFTQVVDNLILSQRQTPILDDFNRELKTAHDTNRRKKPDVSISDPVCVDCSGSGWRSVVPPGAVVPTAYACDCKTFEDPNLEDSAFSDQDRTLMLRTISARVQGKVSDAEWSEFKKNIDATIKIHSTKSVNTPQYR